MKRIESRMDRREFLRVSGAATTTVLLGQVRGVGAEAVKKDRPNILWISTEHMSPNLGCYGDSYAVTPNIDKFAGEGVLYSNAYTHGPVCAPTRSGIITGVYPTSIGAQHMRCRAVPPNQVKCFTEYLRAAGYYCTNNAKTDYQFEAPLTAWDENGRSAHWRGRGKGQKFFAVFNLHITGESRTRDLSERYQGKLAAELGAGERHDPAKAPLPPYYPDTEVVRRDIAQHYDNITLMDKEVGKILAELEADGLAEETIVWFWSDHGRGMPRAQRWVYDSGIGFPLIVRVPEKWRRTAWGRNPAARAAGSKSDELVGSIDFAPTMLSLAGLEVPGYMAGRAFMGKHTGKERDYIYAARDRMDEAIDVIRAVRDKRYKYIRNYMPHITYGQNIAYMDMMPTMQQMRQLNAEGKLEGAQKQYFRETKAVEELYDTAEDPHEINNLAEDPQYREVLERMRKVHQQWAKETKDTGLIPEPELNEMKFPGGVIPKTAEPRFHIVNMPGLAGNMTGLPGSRISVTISCPTSGASIAYKTGRDNVWRLYSGSVVMQAGELLVAKAFRLGFEASDEAEFQFGNKAAPNKEMFSAGEEKPHWTDVLDKGNIMQKLRDIKELDSADKGRAIAAYTKALGDKDGAVRYWAVVGLYNRCKEQDEIEAVRTAIVELAEDRSAAVRIAAAEAICGWTGDSRALAILVRELKNDSEAVRLHAITALDRLGDKAGDVLEDIREAAEVDVRRNVGTKLEYVRNVARKTLDKLEN